MRPGELQLNRNPLQKKMQRKLQLFRHVCRMSESEKRSCHWFFVSVGGNNE